MFSVLRAVAQSDRTLGVSELSVQLGIPKPTMHRIVRMLEAEGLLERGPSGRRLQAGRRLLDFAFDTIAHSVRSAPRRAILEGLSREVGETCNLGVMLGSEVIYIDRVEAKWPLGLRFEPGSRVPLHCTAIGKLFLSFQPPQRRRQLIAAQPLQRYTEKTVTDPEELEAQLARVRARGISIDDQEFLAGVVCLAVPIRNSDGTMIAGLAVSAPQARLSVEKAEELVPTLQRTAISLADGLVGAD